MFALFVTIKLKPEHRERYLEEMLGDALGSIRDEPGCLRFDVLIDAENPNTIYLYEIYRDEAAFQEHLQAPHFIKWRDAVVGWTEGPSTVVRATTYFPADEKWQKQPS
jgi:(4S)-4-hydroxy-5-phosphonooxypentane-2,3-dione isomerase